MHVYSGADTGFSKRGVWDPRYEKRCGKGGWGGGGGAVRFRPETKMEGARHEKRGGGCCPLQARYKKRGVCVCVWGGGGDAVYLRPAIRKAEGGGEVLSGASVPIQKAGSGGAA